MPLNNFALLFSYETIRRRSTTADEVKRKLTVILRADGKDYTRLMGGDEMGTACTLNVYKEAITDLIQHYQGREGRKMVSVLESLASLIRRAGLIF